MYAHRIWTTKQTISGTTSKTYCQAHGMLLARFEIVTEFLDMLFMTRSKSSSRAYVFHMIMLIE
jgi:hypothetical protein